MGNLSSIPIDHFFEDPLLVNNKKPIYVLVNLKVDQVLIECGCKKLTFLDPSEHEPDYTWTPDSHMRDFEVLLPFTSEEIRIARGQGIGVLILENVKTYIKLVYDTDGYRGIRPESSIWDHSDTAKEILHKDLSIGYDVLLVTSDGTAHHLCEDRDERDDAEPVIFFAGLEKYAKYEPET